MRLGLPQRVDKLWKRLRQITTPYPSGGCTHNIGQGAQLLEIFSLPHSSPPPYLGTSTSMYHNFTQPYHWQVK